MKKNMLIMLTLVLFLTLTTSSFAAKRKKRGTAKKGSSTLLNESESKNVTGSQITQTPIDIKGKGYLYYIYNEKILEIDLSSKNVNELMNFPVNDPMSHFSIAPDGNIFAFMKDTESGSLSNSDKKKRGSTKKKRGTSKKRGSSKKTKKKRSSSNKNKDNKTNTKVKNDLKFDTNSDNVFYVANDGYKYDYNYKDKKITKLDKYSGEIEDNVLKILISKEEIIKINLVKETSKKRAGGKKKRSTKKKGNTESSLQLFGASDFEEENTSSSKKKRGSSKKKKQSKKNKKRGSSSKNSNENIAKGKKSSSSSIYYNYYNHNKAFDGNTYSIWASKYATNHWLQVDLGSDKSINGYKLDIYRWYPLYNFKIQYSSDGKKWNDFDNIPSNSKAIITSKKTSVKGRYWRMSTNFSYRRLAVIREFELYEGSSSESEKKVSDSSLSTEITNIAVGKPVTTSGVDSTYNAAKYCVDGNSNTRWASNYNDDAWIIIDLEKNYTVEKIKLSWETAYGKKYYLQISDDQKNWKNIYHEENGYGGNQDIEISKETGRYIKLQGIKRGTGWGYSIYEFEIYGSEQGSKNKSKTSNNTKNKTQKTDSTDYYSKASKTYTEYLSQKELKKNEKIVSKNGKYALVMQSDGNLKIYKDKKPVWDVELKGKGEKLTFDKGITYVVDSKGNNIWNIPGNTSFSNSKLVYALSITDEGNIVVIDSNHMKTLWKTYIVLKDAIEEAENKRKQDEARSSYSKKNISESSVNKVLALDGKTQLTFKDKDQYNSKEFSVQLSILVDELPLKGTKAMILSKSIGLKGKYSYYVSSDGNLYFSANTGSYPVTLKIQRIERGKWYNLTAVNHGSKIVFYNGSNRITEAGFSGKIVSGNEDNYIGSIDAKTYFQGKIDNLLIWTKALSTNEISDIVKNGQNKTDSDLITYYRFNEIKNDKILDLSGNNNDISARSLKLIQKSDNTPASMNSVYRTSMAFGNMYKGQSIETENKIFSLKMQNDGNLKLYAYDKVIWDAKLNGRGNRLHITSGGTLKAFDSSKNLLWQPKNNSDRRYNNGVSYYRLGITEDGEMGIMSDTSVFIYNSIYKPTEEVKNIVNAKKAEKWKNVDLYTRAKKTYTEYLSTKELKKNEKIVSKNGKYALVMQEDGNLKIYENKKAVWDAGINMRGEKLTFDKGVTKVVDAAGQSVWNMPGNTSFSNDRLVYALSVTDEGNIVVIDSNHMKTLWKTYIVLKNAVEEYNLQKQKEKDKSSSSKSSISKSSVNKVLAFDGKTRLSFKDGDKYKSKHFTIEISLCVDEFPKEGSAMILSKSLGYKGKYAIYVNSRGQLNFSTYTSFTSSSSVKNIDRGKWYKFTVVNHGWKLVLFNNGRRMTEGGFSGKPYNGNEDNYLGSHDGKTFFKGKIDYLRIWNRMLTEDEIKDKSTNGQSKTEADLVTYFNFDEVKNGKIIDLSGNGNNISTKYAKLMLKTDKTPAYKEPKYKTSVYLGNLYKGQKVITANEIFKLKMQTDGNLKLYAFDKQIWDAGLNGKGDRLHISSNSIIKVYDKNDKAIWQPGKNDSRRFNNGVSYYRLGITEDGELGIMSDTSTYIYNRLYKPTKEVNDYVNSKKSDKWKGVDFYSRAKTIFTEYLDKGELKKNEKIVSKNGNYALLMQEDGNLTFYENKKLVWDAGLKMRGEKLTFKNGVTHVVDAAGESIWSIPGNTQFSNSRLVYALSVTNEGNIAVIDSNHMKTNWKTYLELNKMKEEYQLKKQKEKDAANSSSGSISSSNVDKALVLDGKTRLSFTDGDKYKSKYYTVEISIKVDEYPPSGKRAMVLSKANGIKGKYSVFISDDGKINFSTYTSYPNIVKTYSKVEKGKWYNIACVHHGWKLVYYLNGRRITEGGFSGNTEMNNDKNYLGSSDNNTFFKGQIDNLRIWTKKFDEDEYKKIYKNGVEKTDSDLVTYFKFDAEKNGIVKDLSGKGNDLNIGNSKLIKR